MVIDLLSFRPNDRIYIISDVQRYHGYEVPDWNYWEYLGDEGEYDSFINTVIL